MAAAVMAWKAATVTWHNEAGALCSGRVFHIAHGVGQSEGGETLCGLRVTRQWSVVGSGPAGTLAGCPCCCTKCANVEGRREHGARWLG